MPETPVIAQIVETMIGRSREEYAIPLPSVWTLYVDSP